MKLSIHSPRPICKNHNCDNHAAPYLHHYDEDGNRTHTNWRNICTKCHNIKTAAKYGLKRISQITAKRAGLPEAEYKNQSHPSLKYRKDYCENIDSRLGFKCNTRLPTKKMLKQAGVDWIPKQFLEVDHIDGNSENDTEENYQTLCTHCHSIKGIQNGDHLSIGRTKLKRMKVSLNSNARRKAVKHSPTLEEFFEF